MKYYFFSILLFPFFVSCTSTNKKVSSTPEIQEFNSDYYVFISENAKTPIIIPLDVNWTTYQNHYTTEMKAWYGTVNTWPIIYEKNSIHPKNGKFPNEILEHQNSIHFLFNNEKSSVTVKIANNIKVELEIPRKSDWVGANELNENDKNLSAAKTTVRVNNKEIKGWILYERIRWTQDKLNEFGDFGAFYWIPLIIEGKLYLFEEHNKLQEPSYRWIEKENLITAEESTEKYTLTVERTTEDKKSARNNIPETFHVVHKKWGLDIILESKGGQIGYGNKFSNGLAYYRQSLLESNKNSKTKSYGMLELILEND